MQHLVYFNNTCWSINGVNLNPAQNENISKTKETYKIYWWWKEEFKVINQRIKRPNSNRKSKGGWLEKHEWWQEYTWDKEWSEERTRNWRDSG